MEIKKFFECSDGFTIDNISLNGYDGEAFEIKKDNKKLIIDISGTVLNSYSDHKQMDLKKIFNDLQSKEKKVSINSNNIEAFLNTYGVN